MASPIDPHPSATATGPAVGLLLAAGGAARFGAVKQLARVGGRPMIEWPLRALRDAGLEVIAVLGAHAVGIAAEADLKDADVVVADGWAAGQSASLAAGLAAARAQGFGAVVVALGDQPLLDPRAIRRVVEARGPSPVVRAAYSGIPGHPTLIEAPAWPRLEALRGDVGAREVLRALSVELVACDGLGAPDDVDTPDALEAVRARFGPRPV